MIFTAISPLLAATLDNLPLPTGGVGTGVSQALSGAVPVVIGALVVVFALIIWASFLRPSDRRRERGEILDRPVPERSGSSGSNRRRRRREKGRPRNPTLAETGGLPPLRDPNAPPPPL